MTSPQRNASLTLALSLVVGLCALASCVLSLAGKGPAAALLSLLSLSAFAALLFRSRLPAQAEEPGAAPTSPESPAGPALDAVEDLFVPSLEAIPVAEGNGGALPAAGGPGEPGPVPFTDCKRLRGALGNLGKVITFADQVVMDVSSSSMGLKAFTGMQAESVEQVSASIMEMDSSLRSAAEEAGSRRLAAEGLVRVVKAGGKGVEETNERMKLIDRDLGHIKDIAALIDDIAERTRLLGMNAAIEAAHSGAAGRGFQVIAAEIRKLSDSTTSNSRGIAEAVASISASVRQALAASTASATTFAHIDSEVGEFIQSLDTITDSMGKLSSSSSGILESVRQVGQVTQSIKDNAQAMMMSSERIERSLDEVRTELRELDALSAGHAAEGADGKPPESDELVIEEEGGS